MVSNKHLYMVSAQQAYISICLSIYLCFIIPSQFLHSEDDFLNVLNQIGRFMQIIRSKVETWVC